MPSDTVKTSQALSQDRRQDDRRRARRISIPQGVPLTARMETPDRVLRSAQCINLSPNGALLDFGEGKCPRLEKNSKLLVILRLAGEVASIPGVVRHRTDNRIGLSFNLELLEQSEADQQGLATILGILERAVERRTSSLPKNQPVLPTAPTPQARTFPKVDSQPLTSSHPKLPHDRRSHERRLTPRIPILQGIPLRAEVVTPDRILRSVRCVDLSSQGALLDFGTGKCPPLDLNAQVLVNLHIGGNIANIPSFIRHRTNNRIGVEFPFKLQPQLKEREQDLGIILGTLERAVARRRSR